LIAQRWAIRRAALRRSVTTPERVRDLNNLASLLYATNRLAEAEALSGRAARFFLVSLRMDHPKTQKARTNYLKILQDLRLPETEIEAKLEALENPL